MTAPALRAAPPWRVAVTRDEAADGPLSRALDGAAFVPWPCPILIEAPPADPEALARAAATLERYDWIVCASVRSVRALAAARTATVAGRSPHGRCRSRRRRGRCTTPVRSRRRWSPTATAPTRCGRACATPTRGPAAASWCRRRRADGACSPRRSPRPGRRCDEVETYRMEVRPAAAIAGDWRAAAPDAAVIASPRVATVLVEVVGAGALRDLRGLVAIGDTTAAALTAASVAAAIAGAADFTAAARTLAGLRDAEAGR